MSQKILNNKSFFISDYRISLILLILGSFFSPWNPSIYSFMVLFLAKVSFFSFNFFHLYFVGTICLLNLLLVIMYEVFIYFYISKDEMKDFWELVTVCFNKTIIFSTFVLSFSILLYLLLYFVFVMLFGNSIVLSFHFIGYFLLTVIFVQLCLVSSIFDDYLPLLVHYKKVDKADVYYSSFIRHHWFNIMGRLLLKILCFFSIIILFLYFSNFLNGVRFTFLSIINFSSFFEFLFNLFFASRFFFYLSLLVSPFLAVGFFVERKIFFNLRIKKFMK